MFRGGSVLELAGRLLKLPIKLLNDEGIQLLYGKGIERRRLIPPSDWNARDMCSVLVWEMLGANRYENPVIFL